ncbi:UDP-N-acetylmuramate dehydrogenase [Salinimicrobium catena]|uniref:UDP-N-acetylenolpyruvoylglucosamine reductase n=1 Tax=Salinimicrobium catena TaxID=390640 RepID=A0A1H5PF60_9FLAO|nr:UDP-N-acetylmuramate dehydrogenase [Salinimicrobium catena]SDL82822.1 UDP-N-acetylmuramate dehydrogenase [Salinimicrobium catena]SEF12509.1 UDP-N-acetylmuramate dehydrogenase [Salinimicrobium catena]
MKTSTNKSLKNYNTFGIDVKARKFVSVESVEELRVLLKNSYASELFILGGGSNMLLTKDVEKTVVHINLKGIKIIEKTDEEVLVEAMAGENWHQFVLFCIDNGFGGLENLSLIPGNVGTAPIQNIGAYGVEIKDTFEKCTALDVQTLEIKTFNLADCEFGYRDSIFKNAVKGKYIITSVTFRLTRKDHRLNTAYGSIDSFLEEKEITEPGIKDVSDAVISIRRSKLPDPKKIGNSGSFFKNPVITKEKHRELQEIYPEMPFYEIDEDHVKIPAGWLIDHAGLKGYRTGDAGVHSKQALVLVNYGNASGEEILRLSKMVQERVFDLFGILLQPEVNIF